MNSAGQNVIWNNSFMEEDPENQNIDNKKKQNQKIFFSSIKQQICFSR